MASDCNEQGHGELYLTTFFLPTQPTHHQAYRGKLLRCTATQVSNKGSVTMTIERMHPDEFLTLGQFDVVMFGGFVFFGSIQR